MVEMTEQFVQRMMHQMDEMSKTMTQTMRGEMGQCLQAGKMAAPRGDTMEPARGSVDCVGAAGEDRVFRETCWARSVKVTETVTQGGKLMGVTETCTSETGREVTELTETREIEERLHGKDGVGDAHTHIELARDDERESSQSVLGPGAGSWVASFGNGGRRCPPLKRLTTR